MSLTKLSHIPTQEGKAPIMVEFPVEPALAPFLVTSARDVMWIDQDRQGHVRTALRGVDIVDLDRRIILAVKERGLADAWGNIHNANSVGLSEGVRHLADYGFTELDYYKADGCDAPSAPGLSPIPAKWVPPGHAVLVPRNREYVGTTLAFAQDKYAAVIHNAARGIVILVA